MSWSVVAASSLKSTSASPPERSTTAEYTPLAPSSAFSTFIWQCPHVIPETRSFNVAITASCMDPGAWPRGWTPTTIYVMASRAASTTQSPPIPAGLTRDQLLEIYCYLRLTRTLEERLTALYRQSKVIGGLFRSLGQEGESVGSASTGPFHEGVNFDAVQKVPLVVIAEYNRWAYSTPPEKQFAVKDLAEKAQGYGIPAVTVDGNDVLAVYEATKFAVERARRGHGVHFIEVKTYRRKGHAEHDDQHYVPKEELDWWAKENDPVDRYVKQLVRGGWAEERELKAIDDGVKIEIDQATDSCIDEPLPAGETALGGVYADPAAAPGHWYRSL